MAHIDTIQSIDKLLTIASRDLQTNNHDLQRQAQCRAVINKLLDQRLLLMR